VIKIPRRLSAASRSKAKEVDEQGTWVMTSEHDQSTGLEVNKEGLQGKQGLSKT
jgi:hypothetical protein